MARDFTEASSHILTNASALITAYPFTISAWYYGVDNNSTIFEIADGTSDNQYQIRIILLIGPGVIRFRITEAGSGTNCDTNGNWTANTWQNVIAFVDGTNMECYINNGSAATPVARPTFPTVGDPGLNTTGIGGSVDDTPGLVYMNGRIAEVGIWNAALGAGDRAALQKYSPSMVRPSNLTHYWPLIGRTSPEPDIVGGAAMTVTGAAAGNHPPIIKPAKPFIFAPTAVGGADVRNHIIPAYMRLSA